MTGLGVDLGAGISRSESTQRYVADAYGANLMRGRDLSPLQVSIHAQMWNARPREGEELAQGHAASEQEKLELNTGIPAPESTPLPKSGLKEVRQTLPLRFQECPWGQRGTPWSSQGRVKVSLEGSESCSWSLVCV